MTHEQHKCDVNTNVTEQNLRVNLTLSIGTNTNILIKSWENLGYEDHAGLTGHCPFIQTNTDTHNHGKPLGYEDHTGLTGRYPYTQTQTHTLTIIVNLSIMRTKLV